MVRAKNYDPQEYDVVLDTIAALKNKVRDIQRHSGYDGDRFCAEAMEMINFMQTDESFYYWGGDTDSVIEEILKNAGLSEAEIHHRALCSEDATYA